ncbi:MAG TPA: tetratricopeptide repeat protein [Gemmatimonadales bacterium]|jgi:tetratricopeptide (TPR) repeat protein|nr:tetratricopeptide repeat protein [Gemmatimonadales bacterium]
MRRLATVTLAVTLACARSAADHEELGDRLYAAGSFPDALAEYQLGVKAHPGSGALQAKLAAAALHTENYQLAADAYRALAREDRSRADEAADGLDRVVRAAVTANDRSALADALTGIREIAPGRPLGRYVTLAALDAVDRGDTTEALALLPVAAAAAADASRADSLLYAYGMTLVRVRDCGTAVPVFEAVIRRQRAPAVIESAREGLGLCALVEGQLALERGRPADAEDWFRRATAPGASPDVVRAAFLGLGDVRLAQGDVAGALESYQQALVGGTPGDTLAQRAQEKINALGKAEPE